jgi:hypothetical protein
MMVGSPQQKKCLGIQPMKDNVIGENICQKIKYFTSTYHLNFDKFHGICTNRTPVMVKARLAQLQK